MNTKKGHALSRRERQIMDILYQNEKASALTVLDQLPDPPSYSAVRAMLKILEEKGHVKHTKDGNRYIYAPTRPRSRAGRSALKQVLQTFYDGSVSKTVSALLDISDQEISQEELARLAKLIEEAKREDEK